MADNKSNFFTYGRKERKPTDDPVERTRPRNDGAISVLYGRKEPKDEFR